MSHLTLNPVGLKHDTLFNGHRAVQASQFIHSFKHTAMLLSSVARVAQPVKRGRSRARARCLSICRSVDISRDTSHSATKHRLHSNTSENGLYVKLKAQHIQSMRACRQVCAAVQDSPVEVTDEAESGWGKTTSQLVSLSTVAFAFLLLPQVTGELKPALNLIPLPLFVV